MINESDEELRTRSWHICMSLPQRDSKNEGVQTVTARRSEHGYNEPCAQSGTNNPPFN
jgi:hypothetical protein